MRTQNDAFTLAVTGSGRLVGMFFTECSKAFPKVTMYDRTGPINAARSAEASLGRTAYASPEFRREAVAIQANLARPTRVAVTVNFGQTGPNDLVTVSGRTSRRTLSYNIEWAGSIALLVYYVMQVVGAVGQAD